MFAEGNEFTISLAKATIRLHWHDISLFSQNWSFTWYFNLFIFCIFLVRNLNLKSIIIINTSCLLVFLLLLHNNNNNIFFWYCSMSDKYCTNSTYSLKNSRKYEIEEVLATSVRSSRGVAVVFFFYFIIHPHHAL